MCDPATNSLSNDLMLVYTMSVSVALTNLAWSWCMWFGKLTGPLCITNVRKQTCNIYCTTKRTSTMWNTIAGLLGHRVSRNTRKMRCCTHVWRLRVYNTPVGPVTSTCVSQHEEKCDSFTHFRRRVLTDSDPRQENKATIQQDLL